MDILDVISKTVSLPSNVTQRSLKQEATLRNLKNIAASTLNVYYESLKSCPLYSERSVIQLPFSMLDVKTEKRFNMINSQVSLLIYRDDDPLTTRVVGTEGA